MSERGNKKNIFLDKYLGIPLTIPCRVFRVLDKAAIKNGANKPLKIGILCMGAIGDLLMCSALINGLTKESPDAQIDVYTTKANEPVVPLLMNVVNSYSYKLSDIFSMLTKIRSKKYDYFLDTTQWAKIGALISAFSGANTTIGFKTQNQYRSLAYDISVPHSSKVHEYINFLELGKTVFPEISSEPEIKIPFVPVNYPKHYIVCHMFATGSNDKQREWGVKNWKKLSKILISNGYNLLFSGSPSQREEINKFMHFSGLKENVFNIAGNTSIPELASIFAGAYAVVSINTGPMHLAGLCGALTIALNGPTNPVRWGAVGEHVINLKPENAVDFLNLGFEEVAEESNCSNICFETVIKTLERLIPLSYE